MSVNLNPKFLGLVDYEPTYTAMQAFTATRTEVTPDELWICEHLPVYTQGLAGKKEHIFNPGHIPVVQTNRGGQVTYHGPGQVVAYPLLDLKRAGYFVKEYVYRIEEAVIRTLLHFGVTGHRVAGAPGIYVRLDDPASHALLPQRPMKIVKTPDARSELFPDAAGPTPGSSAITPAVHHQASPNFTGLGKIGALGIKVSRNCTYHGVALNVAMDLEPYSRINPCGYQGLQTVDLSTIGTHASWQEVADVFSQKLATYLAP
ncbi:octanoyltransferase [Rhodoferax lithotrophicus]|uniref:Octanoyltransferase n=1 Tax=Rhodoferax lithotrophicus TaxID=2798804 RepID=A0ABN6DCZ1_9BURK|nr:octanoyltransferase [Rhodoferax sp. MIZ03]